MRKLYAVFQIPNVPKSWRWYHATRALGVLCILWGLFVDHSGDRGSIILGGFGLLGIEKVAKSDESRKD